MATRELKPGMIVQALINQPQGTISDAYALKNSQNGQFPGMVEMQVIPGAGNTGFSVTLEHTLDPTATNGWQTVGTVTTGAPVQVTAVGGWYRCNAGTATGGPVTALLVAS
jgi:hypothetical protein